MYKTSLSRMAPLLSFFAAATLLGGATPTEAQDQDLVVFKVHLHPKEALKTGRYDLTVTGSFETDEPSSHHKFQISQHALNTVLNTRAFELNVGHMTSTSHLDFTPTIKKITITKLRLFFHPIPTPVCVWGWETTYPLVFELSLSGSSESILEGTFTAPTLGVNLSTGRHRADNFAEAPSFDEWRYNPSWNYEFASCCTLF